MAKISLADNLKLTTEVPGTDQPTPTQVPRPKKAPGEVGARRPSGTDSGRSTPRFDDYEPITARMSQDQVDDLDRLAKRLERAKPTGLPRITRNTLVRVAIDVLLANAQDLAGPDEESLRNALLRTTQRAN